MNIAHTFRKAVAAPLRHSPVYPTCPPWHFCIHHIFSFHPLMFYTVSHLNPRQSIQQPHPTHLNLSSPFLFLHFSYYTLMTILIRLSVILLSMLMILLSLLSVIRHLICDNKQNWCLNLNLIYETRLLILVLEKLNWFHLIGRITITLVLLIWKWMGLF